jgi:hypothetical protein
VLWAPDAPIYRSVAAVSVRFVEQGHVRQILRTPRRRLVADEIGLRQDRHVEIREPDHDAAGPI